jgi:hypothetical protein
MVAAPAARAPFYPVYRSPLSGCVGLGMVAVGLGMVADGIVPYARLSDAESARHRASKQNSNKRDRPGPCADGSCVRIYPA